MTSAVVDAIAAEEIGGRLWFYTNYHCNLNCKYCLTESAPASKRRLLDAATIVAAADEAVELGFTAFGVTGGEPFLLPGLPESLVELGRRLPTVVLTNGTLFSDQLIARLRPLADLPVALQLSLDTGDEEQNDAMRGPGSFAKAIAAIPKLRSAGIALRIGTTTDGTDPDGLLRLCELHRSLGISDDDHVTRPIIQRGRAVSNDLGIPVTLEALPAELTLTADGAFWSPAGPTVANGRLDIDYLLTRTIRPVAIPATAMLQFAGGRAPLSEPALRVT